jgi:hypothetical protein
MWISIPVAGLDAAAQETSREHEQALAAIRKLGGEVTVDSERPDAPVAIVLTGASNPGDCLPYLKDVNNLRRCDL